MHAAGLTDFHIADIDRQLVDADAPRTRLQRLNDLATDNNQRFIVKEGKGYAVIPVIGWAYPAGAIRGKEYLIIIDWYNRMGALRKKDPERYAQISKRYKEDLKAYKRNIKQLRHDYSARRDELTSLAFWKRYLGMDK